MTQEKILPHIRQLIELMAGMRKELQPYDVRAEKLCEREKIGKKTWERIEEIWGMATENIVPKKVMLEKHESEYNKVGLNRKGVIVEYGACENARYVSLGILVRMFSKERWLAMWKEMVGIVEENGYKNKKKAERAMRNMQKIQETFCTYWDTLKEINANEPEEMELKEEDYGEIVIVKEGVPKIIYGSIWIHGPRMEKYTDHEIRADINCEREKDGVKRYEEFVLLFENAENCDSAELTFFTSVDMEKIVGELEKRWAKQKQLWEKVEHEIHQGFATEIMKRKIDEIAEEDGDDDE